MVLWRWINDLFARMEIPPVSRRVPLGVAYSVGMALEGVGRLFGKREEPRMTRFLACQLAKSHWFSHCKAERVLGYRPLVSTDVGLARLEAWLRCSGDRTV